MATRILSVIDHLRTARAVINGVRPGAAAGLGDEMFGAAGKVSPEKSAGAADSGGVFGGPARSGSVGVPNR